MIINGFIKSQDLEISAPLIVSDTINFLEFKFYFQTKEWDGLVKWAHFKQSDLSYDLPLQGDSILANQGLALSPGPWKIYIHGSEYVNGEVIQRITTDEATFMVEKSGSGQGGPLPIVPPSLGEQLEARMEELATKEEVKVISDNLANNYTTTTEMNSLLDVKANAADVYDKAEVNRAIIDAVTAACTWGEF